MPITKEHVLDIVNEGLAMRDYCDRFRSELQAIVDQYLAGQDPAVLMELVMGMLTGDRRRPSMEITFAESQYFKRTWKQHDWRKHHMQMRRDIAKLGGNPDDAQMHPRPVSGSKYQHVGASKESWEAATTKAKARTEWLAERLNKAEELMSGESAQVTPLTEAEWDKITKPDDASALPIPSALGKPYVVCPACSREVTEQQLTDCRARGHCEGGP